MHHQPKQLALLISLIGLGVSPYAQARIEEAPRGAPQTLPGVTCNEAEAAALPACGHADDLIWAPQRSGLDLSGTPGVLVLYRAARDDWAPGEASGSAEGFNDPLPTAPLPLAGSSDEERLTSVGRETDLRVDKAETKVEQGAVSPAKTRRIERLNKAAAGVKVDAGGFERVAPLRVADAPVAVRVVPRFAEHSPEAERLLDNLIAILSKPDPTPSSPKATREVAAVEPSERTARMRDADPARLERAEVDVQTQSDHVLRNLGAILVKPRDEVGASRPDAVPMVSTQSDKVLATLQDVARPVLRAFVVEDGPTKRLRKLAVRAEKSAAKAAAEAAAAGVVDVMLPLELPTFAALPKDVMGAAAAMRPEPVSAPKAAPADLDTHASPFGDLKLAVASTSLDRVRGGFSTADGLNISFGIERAVYVNGALVTSTSLNVTDLAQVAAGRAVATLDSSGTMALVQNGSGNSVAAGSLSPSNVGTVIQNTLNGQKIQNITTINATANTLGIYQNLNLGQSLRSAVIGSLLR